MGEVGVERLVEGEVCAVAVECGVDAAVGGCDGRSGYTREKLEEVANTLGAALLA